MHSTRTSASGSPLLLWLWPSKFLLYGLCNAIMPILTILEILLLKFLNFITSARCFVMKIYVNRGSRVQVIDSLGRGIILFLLMIDYLEDKWDCSEKTRGYKDRDITISPTKEAYAYGCFSPHADRFWNLNEMVPVAIWGLCKSNS